MPSDDWIGVAVAAIVWPLAALFFVVMRAQWKEAERRSKRPKIVVPPRRVRHCCPGCHKPLSEWFVTNGVQSPYDRGVGPLKMYCYACWLDEGYFIRSDYADHSDLAHIKRPII